MSKIDRVESIIIKAGGWNNICDDGNQKNILWIIARELNCQYSKAREYVDIVIQSSIAKARMGWDTGSSEPSKS